MRERIPVSWDAPGLFLALWREGSLTAAARALGVDQSTASRRLAALESRLGARLFERGPGGLEPTDAARALAPAAESAEAHVMEFARTAAGADREPRGTVRLAVPEAVDSEVVVPALPRFYARHPGITLELVASNALANLARHEADLALRFVRPKGADLVARRVATLRAGVWGQRAHAQRGIARAHWVVCSDAARTPADAAWIARNVPAANVRLRANRVEAQLAAARQGLGLAVLPDALAERDPTLERCAVDDPPPAATLWLVAHRTLLRVPRVRAVWTFLDESARALSPPAR